MKITQRFCCWMLAGYCAILTLGYFLFQFLTRMPSYSTSPSNPQPESLLKTPKKETVAPTPPPKPPINPVNPQQIALLYENRELIKKRIKPGTVALTFDDGPDSLTSQVLDIFQKHNKQYGQSAKATFFVIGKRAKMNCHLINRMHAEGHEIGNHTYSHPRFNEISVAEQEQEIKKGQLAIQSCNPKIQVYWFRPPYGVYNDDTIRIARKYHLHVALWTIDTNDWRKSSTVTGIFQDATTTNGQDIILMHDGREIAPTNPHKDLSPTRLNTLKALQPVLQFFYNNKIKTVTMSEALYPPKI